MELQLDNLSKWVHRNLSSRHSAATSTTTTTTARQSYNNDEAQVSSSSSTCCSAMSSKCINVFLLTVLMKHYFTYHFYIYTIICLFHHKYSYIFESYLAVDSTHTAVERFRSLIRRSGTRCLTSSEIRRVVLTVLSSFLRQSCLVFTNVTSALEVFLNVMRYINPRFTYLLTY